jgi:hypothetical protein
MNLNVMKKGTAFAVLISCAAVCAVTVQAAEPTMTISPTQPAPLSTITFTAQVDEPATAVRLLIQECNAHSGVCYARQNLSMTDLGDGSYKTTVTLEHQDATYIQYSLLVQTDGGWTPYLEETKVTLQQQSNNNSGGNTNGSPGFEVAAVLLAATFIMMFVFWHKRAR